MRKEENEKYMVGFSKQEYLAKTNDLNIPHKTAEGYITKFVKAKLLHRERNGKYINPQFNANEGIEGAKGQLPQNPQNPECCSKHINITYVLVNKNESQKIKLNLF